MTEDKHRREFLKSVATGGTVALAAWPALADGVVADRLGKGCKVFTVSQAALVGAIAEQFVPQDDYPGAKEAGVVTFIDGILAGPFGRFYKGHYEEGLRGVDGISHERFGRNFVSLDLDRQASILTALEFDKGIDPGAREFFGLILQHTFEGYYGDPEHNGNRNAASWKMIGFEG
jgi:gluconate 2-dehydrogenase gamma chain